MSKYEQYYVAEVVGASRANSANPGDRELFLDDRTLQEGEEITKYMSSKRWKIIAGPFDCPEVEHVLELRRWVREENERLQLAEPIEWEVVELLGDQHWL